MGEKEMIDPLRKLGGLLSSARTAQNKNQREMAAAIGISPSVIGNWEAEVCAPKLTYVPAILEHYKVDSAIFTADFAAAQAFRKTAMSFTTSRIKSRKRAYATFPSGTYITQRH